MLENNTSKANNLAQLVDAFQSQGRYTFDRNEAIAALSTTSAAFKKSVMRLVAKKRIAVPKRGFYVIVPLEYRSAGSPPPSWFIDHLMQHLGRPYYIGVLSAAALHGAAHQQPQEFQVVTDLPVRAAIAGRTRIRFFTKHHHDHTIITEVKTETGTMKVSTPEATALDLLRYYSSAGGLNNVATVLAELAENIDLRHLVRAAHLDGELAYAQRLGYILELVGVSKPARLLAKWIKERNPAITPLRPGKTTKGCPIDQRWHVAINEKIEVDL
jgi:predicted transcriptional regulator of viral defense system